MKKKTKKSLTKKARKPSKPVSKSIKNTKRGIVPLGDRVLIRPFSQEDLDNKTNNYGIIIPDTVSKEKSAQGKVLAVGEGKLVDGKLVPVRVKVGETVVFSKYSYDEVTQDDEELYLLKEENILAVIK